MNKKTTRFHTSCARILNENGSKKILTPLVIQFQSSRLSLNIPHHSNSFSMINTEKLHKNSFSTNSTRSNARKNTLTTCATNNNKDKIIAINLKKRYTRRVNVLNIPSDTSTPKECLDFKHQAHLQKWEKKHHELLPLRRGSHS